MPRLPRQSIERPALVDALERANDEAVALLCAPAGYGKTLLLAEWVRSTGTATAWVSLSPDTNEDRRFWSAVLFAVASCPAVPGDSTLRAIEVPNEPSATPEFLAEVIDGLYALPARFRLILDDIHEITDRDALHGLTTLVRHRSPALRLVLSSRFDPPLPLARLRLTGQLFELRARDLRFSSSEAERSLSHDNVSLRADQLDLLLTRTEGWPAGIRLAAVSLRKSRDPESFLAGFAADDHSIADYLIDEVLSGLAGDTLDFLRAVSVADQLTVPLARVLSGREDAGELLDLLEHDMSLVARNGPDEGYRVHALLRAHLLSDLRRQHPDVFTELHDRAAHHSDESNRPVEALQHAFHTGDPELVSELLHRHGPVLVAGGECEMFRVSMETMRAGAVAPDATLELLAAMSELTAGDVPAAEEHLGRAAESMTAETDLSPLRSLVLAQHAGMSGDTKELARVNEEIDPADADRWGLGAAAFLAQGTSLLIAGQRDAAERSLRSGFELATANGQGFLVAQCQAMRAALSSVTGNYREMATFAGAAEAELARQGLQATPPGALASTLLSYGALLRADMTECARRIAMADRVLDTIGSPGPVGLRALVGTVKGALMFEIDDRATGLALMRSGRQVAGDVALGADQIAAMAMLEHRAAIQMGWGEQARGVQEWAENSITTVGELLVMRARTRIANQRYRAAQEVLRPLLSGAETTVVPWAPVEAWLLHAESALAKSARTDARNAMDRALEVAEPMEILHPFVFAPPAIVELMTRQLGSFGRHNAFVSRAMQARRTETALPRLVALTERERAVLQRLPTLQSLTEIAADLTLSLNTVKTHVRAIYVKLAVQSRRDAVRVAHSQGIIDLVMSAATGVEEVQLPRPRPPS